MLQLKIGSVSLNRRQGINKIRQGQKYLGVNLKLEFLHALLQNNNRVIDKEYLIPPEDHLVPSKDDLVP